MITNKYFRITLDNNKTTFLIRVKKDFYTEGVILNENTLLHGYFDLYNHICLGILDNNIKSTFYEHNGIAGYIDEGLSFVGLDEELIQYNEHEKIICTSDEIENLELKKNIDFLIRNTIKNLNESNKNIYSYYNNRRFARFNEMKKEITAVVHRLNGGSYIEIDDPEINFTRDDLNDIKNYLESLTTASKTQTNGRNENGKKLRKKKNKK